MIGSAIARMCTIGALAALLPGCSSPPRYPVSDHFDGKLFFNPARPEEKRFSDFLELLLARRAAHWPGSVENTPALDLMSSLSQNEVAITFVNHATVLIQTPQLNVLTDPVWSERVSPFTWIGPKRARKPGIVFEDLPRIDLVVVSHNHYDHMDLATLRRLNRKFHPKFLVPLGNQKFLEDSGIENVTELDWWQAVELESKVTVTFTPTQHFSGRGLFDRFQTLWGSYVISYRGHHLYFGGDAAYSTHFKEIAARFGSMEVAFLPIGAYEPRWFMKDMHLDPAQAVQAHLDLQSRQSIGIHFGTFQLTEEGIDEPVLALKASLANRNLPADAFIVLGEGRTRKLSFAHDPD